MTEKQRFFLALLPPKEIQEQANQIKDYFDQVYNSRAAKKSPPHITLQPPFEWLTKDLPLLRENLRNFAQIQPPIPIILDGFGAFRPRVIYIKVLKTPELIAIQQALSNHLESSLNIIDLGGKSRAYSPHLTVAYRDLSKTNFYPAWSEFKPREFAYKFTVSKLTLLIHNGKRWDICEEYVFYE
jgi:2'-5' RNA ligase